MNLNNYKQALCVWVAPIILIVIACFQFYMAHAYDLSPWKGGGFGMFSTVDSQGARFLRIYLITPMGKIPVQVPDAMVALAREVRTIPTTDGLARLAEQLAQATWVPYDYDPFGKKVNASDQKQIAPSDNNGSISNDDQTTQVGQTPDDLLTERLTNGDRPLFRILAIGEPTPDSSKSVVVYGVHAELWRYAFDWPNLQVNSYKYLESSVNLELTQ